MDKKGFNTREDRFTTRPNKGIAFAIAKTAGRNGPASGQRPEVGALAVVVEDGQAFAPTAGRPEGVRDHGGELPRLTGLAPDGALSEPQHHGSRQDGEPVPARMDLQL